MPFEAPKESVLLSPVVKTGRDRPGAGPQGQLCAWAAWAGASQRLDVPCPGWHRGARSGDLVAACSGVPLSLGACPWRIVTLGSSGDSVCRRRGAKGGLPAHGCSPGPVPVGISSHALRIFVLPVGFCAFSLFFFFHPSSLSNKDTYSPLAPRGFTQKAHPPHGERKAGRGSSPRVRCVALCLPFVTPPHNARPRPPTRPQAPKVPPRRGRHPHPALGTGLWDAPLHHPGHSPVLCAGERGIWQGKPCRVPAAPRG